MIQRKFTTDVYRKIGSPDLGSVIYFMKGERKFGEKFLCFHLWGLKVLKKG